VEANEMNNETKILNLLKQNNYVTTKEVEDLDINRKFLSNLVKKKKLVRVARGIYSLPNELSDEYYIISSKSKHAVFSNLTALYFHALNDRIPLDYDVTVRNDYSGSLQKEENVNLYYVDEKDLNIGRVTIKTNLGNEVDVYDVERSICDIIKNKNRLDLELFNKTIRNYFYSSNKDINKLYNYAKKLNILKKVKNTFEVFL
jgi:predicted transcriptional regulator of viral defense system